MKKIQKSGLLLFFLVLFLQAILTLQAQDSPQYFDYPHNHLPWYTIEGDYFLIHYQEGSSRTAQVTSRIAEEIYGPVTDLYDFKPEKKVSIVLRDREDFSNGAAFFFDNKIEIWVPALDTPLRGTHNWLRNVITHEFVHIIQLQASMKRSRRIPAVYLQWLSYEDVRRPDVLYGFPNNIISHPFATVSIPAWFAEGAAQYQRAGFTYDYWDSHRDMILRMSVAENSVLSLVQMGTFTSKSSLEREMVYNQGYSFTIYLVNRFGEDILKDLSRASASGINRFEMALKEVTGIKGEDLFNDWLADRYEYYKEAVENIHFSETELVEPEGFFNFYPQQSADNRFFAYLSNKGRDYARTALYLIDKSSSNGGEGIMVDDISGTDLLSEDKLYAWNHGMNSNPALDFISSKFSFSPDSKYIAYSRAEKNRYGETFQDIHIYDITTRERRQLTSSLRIQEPAWSPDGVAIAAAQLNKGTQNLVTLNPETGEKNQLTDFRSGETVYTPVWHPDGSKIFFASAGTGNREIWVHDIQTNNTRAFLSDPYIDYRDPYIDPESQYLYFSSDPDGIFNIYRTELENENETLEKVTSVAGGAFQPFVQDNELIFSEYQPAGYKIAALTLDNIAGGSSGEYSPTPRGYQINRDIRVDERVAEINHFDDRDLQPLDHSALLQQGDDVSITIETRNAPDERVWSTYSETITGFSFFPVVRFDNYTQLRGRNSRLLRAGNLGALGENLWRDMKLGVIFSSREVTERINLFGGAMFGLGSRPAEGLNDFFSPNRLIDLDRDLFLIAEHRGLPFIKTGWSPTLSLEFYNLKRNVRDGLQIEEFPCTSCLPETVSTNIVYDIWEAGIYLHSKLNRWSLLKLGAAYSPYRVSADGFLSSELRQFIPGSTSEYYRGTTLSASYIMELLEPTRHYDIAPRGLKSSLTYKYEPSRLIDRYEINDGVLSPVYDQVRNQSLEMDVRLGFGTGVRSAGQVRARGFTYLNSPQDSFYLDYIGGLSGMLSYPFFAVGGEQTAFTKLSWTTPLLDNINIQAGQYTLDKLFARVFFEAGNGWNSPLEIGNRIKTGFGTELRFAFNSYYLFPMKLFFSSAYGFNQFFVTFPDDFITDMETNRISYGREMLFYFGITFDFETF